MNVAPSIFLVNVVFYVLAALMVAGGLAVALSKNIVRTAFALLAVLFSAAGMYALMKADFIFAIQILVYVGGILVLIIFAIMLTQRIVDVNVSNPSAPSLLAGVAVLGVLACILTIVFVHVPAEKKRFPAAQAPAAVPDEAMTASVGTELMTHYLYPFEILSVLLLAALIGAAFLARKEVRSP